MQKNLSTCVAVVGGALALSPAAWAQNTPGAPRATAYISSTLEANDNYDLREDSLGKAFLWTNTFGASLTESTMVNELNLNASGTYRYADLPEIGNQSGFDEQRVSLGFSRLGDDDQISFSASYMRNDLDFFDPLDDIDDDGTFDNDYSGGTRESLRANAALSLNQSGPISLSLAGDYDEVNFYDTTDPDTDDRDSQAISGELGFRINPVLRATLGANYEVRRTQDTEETEVTTRGADVGFDAELNERLSSFVRLGYSIVETEENSGDEREEGVVGSIGYRATLENGSTGAMLQTTINENGPRGTITVSRLIRLGNGIIDGDLGVTASEDTPLRAVGRILYRKELQSSRLQISLNQSATTNDDNENVVNTFGQVTFQHDLSALSSVDLSATGGLTRNEDSDTENDERIGITARYNSALTRDWGYNVGYTHEIRSTDEVNDARSNAVFFTLRRDFESLR